MIAQETLPEVASASLTDTVRNLLTECYYLDADYEVKYSFVKSKFGNLTYYTAGFVKPLPSSEADAGPKWDWFAFRRCDSGWKLKCCPFNAFSHPLIRALIVDADVLEMLDRVYNRLAVTEENTYKNVIMCGVGIKD